MNFNLKIRKLKNKTDNAQKYSQEQCKITSTHQLVNMKSIEDAVTTQLCCTCHTNKAVDNFIKFCSNNHDILHEKMKFLAAEWKKQDKMKTKAKSSVLH